MTDEEVDWDAPPHFEVGFHSWLARDGGTWYVAAEAGSNQSVMCADDEDPGEAVKQMERFVERAQAALTELRQQIAAEPPESCRPEHAEPEEMWLGFGGINYQCTQCGAEWFRHVRPGEEV